jgi:hypothetical protein
MFGYQIFFCLLRVGCEYIFKQYKFSFLELLILELSILFHRILWQLKFHDLYLCFHQVLLSKYFLAGLETDNTMAPFERLLLLFSYLDYFFQNVAPHHFFNSAYLSYQLILFSSFSAVAF